MKDAEISLLRSRALAVLRRPYSSSLTFGAHIEKILPTSCSESLAVEGPDGRPCTLKRFSAWTAGVMSHYGSYHLDEFERIWVDTGVKMSLFIVIPLGLCMLMKILDLKLKAKESAEEWAKRQ